MLVFRPDDGSGGGDKMVPEHDLISIKRGLNATIKQLETDLAAANQRVDDEHASVLRVTASRQDVESKLAIAQGLTTEVDSLKTQLTEATTSRDGAQNALTGLRRMAAATTLGVDAKTLEGKTDDQLDSMLEGAKLVGTGSGGDGHTSSRQLAGGGTGGKSFSGLTPREKIKAGLEIAQQSQQK